MPYSIWVIPSEPLRASLQNVIDELAVVHSSPSFEPHMTVLGNVVAELGEIEQKLAVLAKRTSPLELSLGPVSFSTTYFQSVLVRVNSTAELLQLNLDLKKSFGMRNEAFMPHISLMYGDHSMAEREEVALSLTIPATTFVVNSFVVTPATLNPKEWEHVVTVPFEGI